MLTRTRLCLSLLIAIGSVALASSALAGTRRGGDVVVDLAGRKASGAMGSARDSAGGVQQIGCTAAIGLNGAGTLCLAISSSGVSAACVLPDNFGLLDVTGTMAEDSFLEFTWDAFGTCTSFEVRNYSYYRPKTL